MITQENDKTFLIFNKVNLQNDKMKNWTSKNDKHIFRHKIWTIKMINLISYSTTNWFDSHFVNDLQNDKLLMKITRIETCKMVTQENDKSISKKQKSDQIWVIIFLGKVCRQFVNMTIVFTQHRRETYFW